MFKAITLAAAISLLTVTTAQAGGLSPVVAAEPEVIVVEEQPSSFAGWIIPVILIALIAVAMQGEVEDAPSDARLKVDIVPVGFAPNGLALYQFRYVGLPTVYEGVMAQDVLMHTPEAVVTFPGGYMGVNYQMLGLTMRVIN